MSEVSNLLVEIQNAAGCSYLSDLHTALGMHNKQAKMLILAIPLERYPLQDWIEAATYIQGKKCSFESKEEARAKIVSAMESN